jgi:hypothetical protein
LKNKYRNHRFYSTPSEKPNKQNYDKYKSSKKKLNLKTTVETSTNHECSEVLESSNDNIFNNEISESLPPKRKRNEIKFVKNKKECTLISTKLIDSGKNTNLSQQLKKKSKPYIY